MHLFGCSFLDPEYQKPIPDLDGTEGHSEHIIFGTNVDMSEPRSEGDVTVPPTEQPTGGEGPAGVETAEEDAGGKETTALTDTEPGGERAADIESGEKASGEKEGAGPDTGEKEAAADTAEAGETQEAGEKAEAGENEGADPEAVDQPQDESKPTEEDPAGGGEGETLSEGEGKETTMADDEGPGDAGT